MCRRCRIVYRGLILSLIALIVSIPIVSARQYSLRSMSSQEAPSVIWERHFGGPQWDYCFAFIEVSTGGYALTGYTDSPWAGQEGKIWLVRLDSEGEMLWNQTYRYVADPEQSRGYSLLECSDGGFAIAGYLRVTTHIETVLIRTDTAGNQLWNLTYGQGLFEDMVQCPDGGFALFGSTERDGVIGNDDFYLARTDSEGNLIWNYTYGGTEADLSTRQGLVLCSDGGFAMLGGSFSFGPEIASKTEILVVRVDSSGNLLWRQAYGGTGYQYGKCLLETDSGFIVAGTTYVSGPLIIHTDADGNMISDHKYLAYASWHSHSAVGSAESMVQCSSGGYAIAGSGTGASENGGWLLRIDDRGYYLWDNFYSNVYPNVIVESSEGGFVMAGQITIDPEASDIDIWVMRVADQPAIPVSRIAAGALGIAFSFILGIFVIRRRAKWPGL